MGRPRKAARTPSTRVICYTRVSTDEQADSGLGLEAQRVRLQAEMTHRGWSDVEWIEDPGVSAKTLDRPGIRRALELLATNQAGVLAVAKLDRLSRSVIDFAGLMAQAQHQGWALVVLDLGVDMTTATGRMVAGIMAQVAEWEREQIGERTRAALAVKRDQGVRLGRPRTLAPVIVAQIVAERGQGRTLTAIADDLTAAAVPTAHGGAQWYPSTVAAVLRAAQLDQEAAATGE